MCAGLQCGFVLRINEAPSLGESAVQFTLWGETTGVWGTGVWIAHKTFIPSLYLHTLPAPTNLAPGTVSASFYRKSASI